MAEAKAPVEGVSWIASLDIPDGGWRYSVGPFRLPAIASGREWA
jgi:hypothetical protein